MNEQSIEFGNLEDPLSPKIIRKSFRIPVEASDDVTILIKGVSYKVADISLDGISFYLEAESDFTIEEVLSKCELSIRGGVIKHLEGMIVHYSSEDGKKGKYGIKWMGLKATVLKQIETIFSVIKKEYLSKSASDPDSSE